MRPIRLFFALGTRPEAIKLAPLILCCREAKGIDVTVCNTGQHKLLAKEMLAAFGIEPDLDLEIMRSRQSLTEITTNILQAIDVPLNSERPDWVVVQGDTTTSFAAALAAFYRKIPVAHVEAGLRTGDRYSPWPEEINRRLNSVLASAHFAPTDKNRANLIAEGIAADSIVVTGNTGIDALLHVTRMFEKNIAAGATVRSGLVAAGLKWLEVSGDVDNIVVVTAHRRENFGKGIEAICCAIVTLAGRYPDLKFVFPVHPNPEVSGPVDRIIRSAGLPNVYVIAPLDYVSFAYLLRCARLIVSDSGGIQEESVALGKRLVILRDLTERVELIGQAGVSVVGTDEQAIVSAVDRALADLTVLHPAILFGDGTASQRIVAWLRTHR